MNNILNDLASESEFQVTNNQCQHIDINKLNVTFILQNVKIGKCLAEDLAEISLKYNVSAVPKFVLFQNGVQVDVLDGADPIQLNKKIQALVNYVYYHHVILYICI